MSALSMVPFPVRIVLGVLAAVLLYKVVGQFGGVLALLAVLAWAVAGIALLYDHGMLDGLGRVPMLGGFFRFVTNRSAVAPGSGDVDETARELTPDERAALLAEGMATLDRLVGIEDVVARIEADVIDLARSTRSETDRGFGTRMPALVILLSGPKGVGKSQTAAAIARIYAGLGTLRTARTVVVGERDVRKAALSMAVDDLAADRARQALGGTLLLDDADWLIGDDEPGGVGRPGVEFGMSLLGMALDHPQELLVLVTLSERAERRLRNDAEHARWLAKLAVRTIAFGHLDEDALVEILYRHLEREELGVDPEAERPIRAVLREEARRFGSDQLDNANAAARAASRLAEAAKRRDPGAGRSGTLTVTRQDAQAAMEDL